MTIMTLKETAEFLKVSTFTIRQLCIQNKIPHLKLGRRYIFTKEALIEWLENQMNQTKGDVANG